MSALFDRRPPANASVTASGASAIAAGGNIRQAVSGPGAVGLYIDSATVLSPEACPAAATVDCPRGLTNLPYRAKLFVGREGELELLDAVSEQPGQVVAQVIHGLGGIGKTTLAAHWAASRRAEHTLVWWITADSPAALDAGLAGLAAALQPSLTTLLPQEQLADWALQWLTTHAGWLLVLDDVFDPGDIDRLLSGATSGRVLITSRRLTGWQGTADRIPLDVLPGTRAAELFTRIRTGADPAGVVALCAELGCLPLAVVQAAAYCAQTDCTTGEYLDDLAAYPADMYTATDESGDSERTIARIWHLTLDRLSDDPLAVRMLLMLAWYAPEDVPRTLLDPLGPPPAVRGALGRLSAHSMVTLHDGMIAVHRLVQAVSRTPAEGDRYRGADAISSARENAVEALAAAVPEDTVDPGGWPLMRTLIPHVEALEAHTGPHAGTDTAAMEGLLRRTGTYVAVSATRSTSWALALLRRAEAASVRLHGPDDPETLEVRVRIADYWPAWGDRDAPVVAYTRSVLADCARVLGEEHPLTLDALGRMAQLASMTGDVGRGRRLKEKVVEARTRVLGAGHPNTLLARASLILDVSAQEGGARARVLAQELVDDCVRVLGSGHPTTLRIHGVLLVVAQGADLEALFGPEDDLTAVPGPVTATAEQLIEASERVFGEHSQLTLVGRISRLLEHIAAGDADTVAASARELEADVVRVLGEDSPRTAEWLVVLRELSASTAAEDD